MILSNFFHLIAGCVFVENRNAGGKSGMIKVLFVCLGNICRSPMAEAIFREQVKEQGLEHIIHVDSAGTGDWHVGNPPHEGTLTILGENNLDGSDLRARTIVPTDLIEFQYVIAMDETNVQDIKKLGEKNPETTIIRLLDLLENVKEKNVPDPYFTGNFQEVYELISKGSEQLLQYIKDQHSLEEGNF